MNQVVDLLTTQSLKQHKVNVVKREEGIHLADLAAIPGLRVREKVAKHLSELHVPRRELHQHLKDHIVISLRTFKLLEHLDEDENLLVAYFLLP